MHKERIIKEEIVSAFSSQSEAEMALIMSLNKEMIQSLVEAADDTDMPFMKEEKFFRCLVFLCMKLAQYDFEIQISKI